MAIHSFAQFFEKAASNVKENVGEDVQTDQLIKEACRNCLEHVSKVQYSKKVCLKRKKKEYSLKKIFSSRPNSCSLMQRKLLKDLFLIPL